MTIGTTQISQFGILLREFRIHARLTQSQLAGLSTVSTRAIRNLEAGHAVNPRPSTVRLLAEALRLSTDSHAQLSLAAGQSPVSVALDAVQCRLPASESGLDRDPDGRQNDLRLALSCLRNDNCGFLSVSGFGGVGKSRLAAALVRTAQHTLHTPWLWLRLAEPGDAGSWPRGSAYQQWNRELISGRSGAIEDLFRLVGDQPYLIVIDDVAHPPRSLEAALRDLVRRCRRLTIVETTRHPAPPGSRRVIPLGPLRLPADDWLSGQRLLGHPALGILIPLIQAVQPDFPLSEDNLRQLLDVCRSLDGIPRALEAAATWFAFYSPSEVAQAAREDPRSVAATNPSAANWLPDAIDDALVGLTDDQRGLATELARITTPWTVDDLTGDAGRSPIEILASLRVLLAVGVIRPADDTGGHQRAYTVLNLLRSSLA